jgi:ATP-dependent Lon protease
MKNMSEQRNNIPATLRTLAHELEKELYGMREVKEQILTFVNARLQNPLTRGCSLALLGPPGTGKTTIARLLSKVLTTPFAQMSFGGVRDASFLKGHDFCYVGSRPGEIVRCLASMEYKNGVLFMDEFEKVSNNKEIVSCLLHIVDPSQNSEFRDSYLREITIDLSNLWFIYSMNSPPEDSALNDRLYKIDVPGYTKKEKLEIVRRYSLKKSLKNAGLKETDIQLSEDVAKYLIDRVSPEKSGIRAIEQALTNVVNKVSFLVNNAKNLKDFPYRISFTVSEKLSYPVNLTRNMIEKFVSVDKEKIEILSHLYM